MGYAGFMRFEPDELAWLEATEEVEIETATPGGSSHRTIIWVVVDGDEAFVRSVNGPTARWYREAVANPAVTVHSRRRVQPAHALHARAEAAADSASVARVSEALRRTYGRDPALGTMLKPEIFDTTLRLAPA